MKDNLNRDLQSLNARATSTGSQTLYAVLNARSIFESRRVPVEDQPSFGAHIPSIAYRAAYEYLIAGIRYLENEGSISESDTVLYLAAQMLEKLFVPEPGELPNRTEELFTAALAYYLSGHYASAYVIMKGIEILPGTAQPFILLQRLFSKSLGEIRKETLIILRDAKYSDDVIAGKLESGEIDEIEVVNRILTATLNRSLSFFLDYAYTGRHESIEQAIRLLEGGVVLSTDQQMEKWWWLMRSSLVILREYYSNSLWIQLQPLLEADSSSIVRSYIQSLYRRERPVIELWRSQKVAVEPINEDDRRSLCIKMPTGTGKTRIAELAILRFLLDNIGQPNRKCIYIAPYRALAIEVEESLRQSLSPLGVRVSELYGGYHLNPVETILFEQSGVLIATPEKVDAFLRYVPELAQNVGLIIIDEGHIIDKRESGLRYELFLHRLLRRFGNHGVRILFVSAVMPNEDQFTKWITGFTTVQKMRADHAVCFSF